MAKIANPIVVKVDYQAFSEQQLVNQLSEKSLDNLSYLTEYPTVYIVEDKAKGDYSVYVGETNDITQRTLQHQKADPKLREDWRSFSNSNPYMYVIGHVLFNKSLTLDIENKLMHYLLSVDKVKALTNRRTNPQNQYYTSEYMEDIFSKIWRKLHTLNGELFPSEKRIQDSAIFKASPFHKLTQEQIDTKRKIMLRAITAMASPREHQLIFVTGEAGSGKTVLLSSIFYDLQMDTQIDPETDLLRQKQVYLLVNHNEQLTVYQQIAERLGIQPHFVMKPTSFINKVSEEEPVDIILVDEAHLLLTQGKQSYRGKNHLLDLRKRAKIVIAIFDEKQILTREQVWDDAEIKTLMNEAIADHNFIQLTNQMRIHSGPEVFEWIRAFVDQHEILPLPMDSRGYDLRIMDSPLALQKAIEEKNSQDDQGLSRIIATYDWPYKNVKAGSTDLYEVTIGDWHMPWNYQLKSSPQKGIKGNLSWAEKEHTIKEVGSTFTIQGFDLNYAGVIIGPSFSYENGKVVIRPENSYNAKATENRTLNDGTKQSFALELLNNELNVLLTRGVKGLYLYAVDPALQEALLKQQKGESSHGQ